MTDETHAGIAIVSAIRQILQAMVVCLECMTERAREISATTASSWYWGKEFEAEKFMKDLDTSIGIVHVQDSNEQSSYRCSNLS
mmetsp:Transcript_81/g.167  ORF Transcript_81/g.167 Transcript_81/m.167 type:complete len:84 (+) Transcript_81:761-1012(+)